MTKEDEHAINFAIWVNSNYSYYLKGVYYKNTYCLEMNSGKLPIDVIEEYKKQSALLSPES